MPIYSPRYVSNLAPQSTLAATKVVRRTRLRGFRAQALFSVLFCLLALVADASDYSMATLDTAPATLLDGQRDDVLRITTTNLGTAGPADLEWVSLGLLLESSPGVPLNAGILSAIEVYADSNQSGVYEPAADALVGVIHAPAPEANGTLSFGFESSDPADIRVPAGQSRTYFIVVALAPGASAQTPHTLRITHLTNGPASSTARAAAGSVLLTMEPTPDVAASTISAQPNTAPTTSGIPDVRSFEPAQPGSVPLTAAFQDAEDAPSQMVYSIAGVTNPAIFSFVGIDAAKRTLVLNYAPGVSGSAHITLRATDRGGLSVATTFKVSVALIQTYADWATFHSASGSQQQDAAGVSNLTKYAFAVNPGAGGDTSGLPRLTRNGNARVFTHLRPKHANDLTYRYEYSTDLAGWQPAINGQHFYQNNTDLGDGRVRVELLLFITGAKIFLRAHADLAAGAPGAPFSEGGPPIPGNQPPPPASYTPPPPGTHPIRGSVVFPQQNVVSTGAQFANAVKIGDLDGDGLRDLVSVSAGDDKVAWYRNLGGGAFGSQQVLTTTIRDPFCVDLVDFDSDGKLDIYVGAQSFTSQAQIVWFRNLGGGSFTGPQTIASGNYVNLWVYSIDNADIDGDGDRDAIFTTVSLTSEAQYDKIGWFPNLGNGTFGPQQLISNPGGAPYCADAGDIDGDGKVDIASADVVRLPGGSSAGRVSWFRGNGNGTFGAQEVISLANNNVRQVVVTDLDRDGALDIVSVASITNTLDGIFYSRIAWYRNLGGGTFAEQVISSTTTGAASATAADLNGDGYPEVIVASAYGNRVVYFENVGGGSFGPEQIISTATSNAIGVAAADLNGDGTMDVVSASQNDNKIAWYHNLGGQFALASADTAPAALSEGARASVLRVSLTNRGQPGDDNARLKTLALLLESAPGVPLTTAQANAVIDSIDIFADTNGSGAFEPTSDALVHTALYLPLTAGKLTLTFNGTQAPEWQVPPGATRHFFVVARLTPNAAAQTPASFRLTHLTTGTPRTTGIDAQIGSPLLLEPAANFTGSFVTAQVNFAPTGGGIPGIIVNDTVAPTSIVLWNYFGDAEDGAQQLQYSIIGNTNPGLFHFAGINSATGVLLLKYNPGTGGTAQLTVRATDSLGKSATATVSVQVQVVASMSDWIALNFPGGIPGASAGDPLLAYGFAIDPRVTGDVRGLPRISATGKARVMSHLRPRYATDLRIDYEISTNMTAWAPAIYGIDYYPFVKDLPGAIQQVDIVILATGQRVFLRAKPLLLP